MKNKIVEVTFEKNRITIKGLRLKPYWKRIWLLNPFANPKFVINNPKIEYKSFENENQNS